MVNSRERVQTALNHQEPDKVPIDLGSTQVTTITRTAYHRLRAHLCLPSEPEPMLCEPCMDVVYPREDLLQRYHVDFRPIQMRSPDAPGHYLLTEDGFYDEFGVRWKKASFYYDAVERPLGKCESVSDIVNYPWPDPCDPGRVRGLREHAQDMYVSTEYALVADIMCLGPFEGACILRGYERFCTDLAADPALAHALLDRVTEIAIGLWEALLNAVGDFIQVAAQGDDIGMQTGLWMSPGMYRKMIKPYHRRMFDFIHSKTDARVFLHSCGSVYDVIPDLIEVGVDILNPLQRSAAKMDIARMKAEFGKDLCFLGGAIDVQQVFPFASAETIELEAQRTLEIMAPGGGYVFVPTHNIQPDVSPDRIEALYQSALRHRDYPVRRPAQIPQGS